VRELALLALPLAGLAYLTIAGAGAVGALAPRLPADARAALSPVAGAALLACASALVPLGAPALPVAIGAVAAGALATVAIRRRVLEALRAGAVPAAVGVCAILLAGAPALARGGWQATSLYGSTDAYHWPSQAKSHLDGPAAKPVTTHPDRLSYERSERHRWAFALPLGVLTAAWLTGADPPDVYAGVAALVFSLLPLVVFACAGACLGWSRRWSAAAGLLVAVNANLLFASHFAWQQQVLGTAVAFAGVMALRLALDGGAGRGEPILAALLVAAAPASYRMGFSPYVAALLVFVVAAFVAANRSHLHRVVRPLAAFGATVAVLAAPSLAALAAGFGDFVSSGGFSTLFKRAFPDGQVAEALGLAPRLWAREQGWTWAVELGWLAVGSVAAFALLAAGALTLRRARVPRADFLLAGAALTLGGYGVLLLPRFASYLSFKVLAYGAPFLVLIALAPFALGRVRAAAAVAAAAVLVVPSTAVATLAAVDDSRTPGALTALPDARLPPAAVVSVALADPWEQAWALYYLRGQRLSVERPSFLLTAEGHAPHRDEYRHRPVTHVLGRGVRGEVVWRAGEIVLARRAGTGVTRARALAARAGKPAEPAPRRSASRAR
jgi:hypothetical protein